MSQAAWTGSISFGLVNIPVRLYPATEPKDVRFHLYDRRTGKRVRYERVTHADEPAAFAPEEPRPEPAPPDWSPPSRFEVVPAGSPAVADAVDAADIVRGVRLDAGELVTVTDDEIGSIAPERSRTIELEEFVDLAEIDPVFFEKTYYVAPARTAGAEKPYALLLRAMQAAGMVGIGRFVLRTRPHLVAVRPLEHSLALETLYFGDEVRSPDAAGGDVSAVALTDREVKMARQLIGAMATKWVAEKHGDRYREDLLDLLRSKTPAPGAPPADGSGAPDVDALMTALRSSVEALKRQRRPAKASG